jgi:hypothetical protein
VRLDPQTVTLTFQTNPGGFELVVNGTKSKATFTRTVIVGSTNTISAVSPQTKGKQTYTFSSWSDISTDPAPATRTITAPDSATTYTAKFSK